MKKKILIILCLLIIITGIYFIHTYNVQKSAGNTPSEAIHIQAVTVCDNKGVNINISEDNYQAFYRYVYEAVPTGKTSVNDVPSTEPFYSFRITSDKISVYRQGFIYEENGEVYMEIPYIGIYKINADVLDMLS
ncbi:MAG: hypothetical protein E7411_07460 [Ruminococcaceae bacterium]|nr:hypothetical protein [Oscillospiraceae bacterium]